MSSPLDTAQARAVETLRAAGLESPEVDARRLAEYAQAHAPAGGQRELFEELVARRAAREPLQHLTGTMHFRFLELESGPGAFSVRPETEWMCDGAIEEARRLGAARIVDLCTGSGAIALAVATEVPGSQVWGVELSAAACAVAERNNARYGGHVRIVRGDARTALGELEGTIDMVVANPPYIPADDEVSAEALADPPLALWGGGSEGLEMPRAIVARAAQLLRPGGLLLMEHAPTQARHLREWAHQLGFAEVETGRDALGRERWLRARSSATTREIAAGIVPGAQAAAANTTTEQAPELARLFPFDSSGANTPAMAGALEAACAAICRGELVIMPTDTVYGIGADPRSPQAVSHLLQAKGRGREKPSPVLVPSMAAAQELAIFDESARALARTFWPGGLTLILPARPGLGWDLGETAGTVALRMPNHAGTLALLEAAGPLAVTSANLTDRPPAHSADEAMDALGHRAAVCLDGGVCEGGVPSTIVRCGSAGTQVAEIVRHGAVGDTEIWHVLSASTK